MTTQEVFSMLSGINIPVAYYQFPDDTVKAPPFICFFYTNSVDVLADNTNYQKVERLVVELYTDNKDFSLESQVETALNNKELVYTRDETYLDSERMYEVIYTTDVVITEAITEVNLNEPEQN